MLWEGTLFLVEVICTAALLLIAGGLPFKGEKEAVVKTKEAGNRCCLKQAA